MVDEHLEALSRRVRRVAQLLHREISAIILELKDPRIHFWTLTKVIPAADLRSAKVFVSVYGTKEEQEETLLSLKHASGYIQHLISSRLRMRYTPVLFFVNDPSPAYSDRIGQILKRICPTETDSVSETEGGDDEE
ncbi:MAG: 30S ribosome-binding factor RbfA [Planctomycetota bacterium]|nr:30S ribosome-binding factor RbfA [Planctomycetota bacterium]